MRYSHSRNLIDSSEKLCLIRCEQTWMFGARGTTELTWRSTKKVLLISMIGITSIQQQTTIERHIYTDSNLHLVSKFDARILRQSRSIKAESKLTRTLVTIYNSTSFLNILLITFRDRHKRRHNHRVQISEGLSQVSTPLNSTHLITPSKSPHQPRPRPPYKTPRPERPCKHIIEPPSDAENLNPTCLCECALWQFVIPPITHHADLSCGIGMDLDFTGNRRLFSNTFDLVSRLQVHSDRVSGRCHFLVEALDFREGRLEAIPLWFILLATFGISDRVLEDGIVLRIGEYMVNVSRTSWPYLPKLELLQRRSASKELKYISKAFAMAHGYILHRVCFQREPFAALRVLHQSQS